LLAQQAVISLEKGRKNDKNIKEYDEKKKIQL
jgi:hypothetical protein